MNKLITCSLLLLGLGTSVTAQADETRCRSAASVYTAPAWGQGTATGNLSDVVTIRDCFGNVYARATVGQWCGVGAPFVLGVVAHSGGQYSIRFCYGAFTTLNALLVGGTVEVTRSGALIDRDRLN
jgi:hypothetical protein